jgi:predicted transcriptional regulator
MVWVYLQIGKGYIPGLRKRMQDMRPPVSQNELAREMGKAPAQVSRWFTENPDRRVSPDMDTVDLIEKAMQKLARKRGQ